MDFNFTREEFEELAQAAPHFETAVKQNAKHNSPKWLDETVKRIYERVAGPQMVNYNCPSCVFQLYQKCGRLWLQDKIKYAALEAEKKKQEEQQIQLPELYPAKDLADTTMPDVYTVNSPTPPEPSIEPVEEIKQPKKRGRKPKNSK